MQKVLLFSILLCLGLAGSQALPHLVGPASDPLLIVVRMLTMVGLAFIMIHVGFEFHIDKGNLRQYGWDYLVAFTAASFPWVFVTAYFVFVMLPHDTWGLSATWKETLLAGRFAAPTSAGVLFSMLAAAGLSTTWLFRKARILAIFDDLDTVLLMIPLKMLMIGLAWKLGALVVVLLLMLVIAYIYLHRVALPITWPWVLGYAAAITFCSEAVYAASKIIDPSMPIHIEVLLPAFVLGCIARPYRLVQPGTAASEHQADDVEHALHAILDRPTEKLATTIVSAAFMVLVGLSMPSLFDRTPEHADDAQHAQFDTHALAAALPDGVAVEVQEEGKATEATAGAAPARITASQPSMGWGMISVHVLMITLLSNLGKMFPAFCYRRHADWRQRMGLAIGMWPRGEVGAGILVLSLSYGIGGPIVTVAMLSLTLNLALTGVFIIGIKALIASGQPTARAT